MKCSISWTVAIVVLGGCLVAVAPARGQGRPTVVFTQSFGSHRYYGGDVQGPWAVIAARARGELDAWVVHRDESGAWALVAQLEPPEGLPFGGLEVAYGLRSGGVAIGEGSIFVAASDARENAGVVVPYTRDAAGRWIAGEPLAPEAPRPGEHFGMALATHGAELAVVAQQRIVLFAPRAGGWEQSEELAMEIPARPSGLAFSDGVLVVAVTGVPCESHVYRREGAIWQRTILENLCGRPSTDGTRIVGMDLRTATCTAGTLPARRCARGVVYTRNGTEWLFTQRYGPIPRQWGLVRRGPEGEEFGEQLGASSALAGERLFLGAWLYGSETSESLEGPGAVLEAVGSTLSSVLPHPSITGGLELDLGRELATDGRTLLVGGQRGVYFVALDRGGSCLEDRECGTGHCADGRCCNTACGGGDPSDCMACAESAGGIEDGTCGPLRAGPAGERICRPGASPCDLPETCSPIETECPADALAPEGARCDGALDLCEIAAVCRSGACEPVERTACEDADPSTCDECDPASGRCTHRPCADAAMRDAGPARPRVAGGCGCALEARVASPLLPGWLVLCALIVRRRRRRNAPRRLLEGGTR